MVGEAFQLSITLGVEDGANLLGRGLQILQAAQVHLLTVDDWCRWGAWLLEEKAADLRLRCTLRLLHADGRAGVSGSSRLHLSRHLVRARIFRVEIRRNGTGTHNGAISFLGKKLLGNDGVLDFFEAGHNVAELAVLALAGLEEVLDLLGVPLKVVQTFEEPLKLLCISLR